MRRTRDSRRALHRARGPGLGSRHVAQAAPSGSRCRDHVWGAKWSLGSTPLERSVKQGAAETSQTGTPALGAEMAARRPWEPPLRARRPQRPTGPPACRPALQAFTPPSGRPPRTPVPRPDSGRMACGTGTPAGLGGDQGYRARGSRYRSQLLRSRWRDVKTGRFQCEAHREAVRWRRASRRSTAGGVGVCTGTDRDGMCRGQRQAWLPREQKEAAVA